MKGICDDLHAEHAGLDEVVASLAAAEWDTATPAEGWTIRDSVSHLWFFDQRATMALEDPEAFQRDTESLMAAVGAGEDPGVAQGRAVSPAELLASWRRDRDHLIDVAGGVDPASRVPWYGPAMAARSFITARLMETWAHGQDVRDALGLAPLVTDRLRHVAHIGVRARPFAYSINGLTLPEHDVRVELRGPGGDTWEWGEPGSPDRVTGEAIDFCLVVTQRRHLADTALAISGTGAAQWMGIAQAFAGPPGKGREPGLTGQG